MYYTFLKGKFEFVVKKIYIYTGKITSRHRQQGTTAKNQVNFHVLQIGSPIKGLY